MEFLTILTLFFFLLSKFIYGFGEEDLAQAFDAALMELISDNGPQGMDQIVSNNGITLSPHVDDCSPSSIYFAYPQFGTLSSENALMRVLSAGKFVVGTRKLDKGCQGDYFADPPTVCLSFSSYHTNNMCKLYRVLHLILKEKLSGESVNIMVMILKLFLIQGILIHISFLIIS
jgi:hypothetical protein